MTAQFRTTSEAYVALLITEFGPRQAWKRISDDGDLSDAHTAMRARGEIDDDGELIEHRQSAGDGDGR